MHVHVHVQLNIAQYLSISILHHSTVCPGTKVYHRPNLPPPPPYSPLSIPVVIIFLHVRV